MYQIVFIVDINMTFEHFSFSVLVGFQFSVYTKTFSFRKKQIYLFTKEFVAKTLQIFEYINQSYLRHPHQQIGISKIRLLDHSSTTLHILYNLQDSAK